MGRDEHSIYLLRHFHWKLLLAVVLGALFIIILMFKHVPWGRFVKENFKNYKSK